MVRLVVPWRAGTASDRNETSDLSGQPFFELKTNTPIIPLELVTFCAWTVMA